MQSVPHVRLRAARNTDANQLAVLATQVWLHTYATEGVSQLIADYVLQELKPAQFAARLTDPAAVLLVAEQADYLVGFAALRFQMPCPSGGLAHVELETLYVQAHFLGQGIGSALLKQAQQLANPSVGSAISANPMLWLTVNARNQRAIDFYTAHRYQVVGTSQFILGGVGHENLVMVGPADTY